MKKIFMLLATASIVFFNANAGVNGIKVAQKGDFDLGLMVGIPPAGDYDYYKVDPKIPTFSLDLSWVLTSGLINTKTFGQNGAIDLGFYYGFTAYTKGVKGTNIEGNQLQNCMLARSAFHFQFVENLDTYGGVFAGVNIWSWDYDADLGNIKDDTGVKAAFGPYIGAKYYFSEKFGAKLEFAEDISEDHNIPNVSIGVTFKF
jgi:hypothetical protein